MTEAEHWRPVVGWEGMYEVSDHGRVRSIDRITVAVNGHRRHYRGKLLSLTPVTKPDGSYARYMAGLYRPPKTSGPVTRTVHSMVLEAFVGPRPEGLVCRHLDGDATNNHLSNLTWGTYGENSRDTVEHGHHPWAARTTCEFGHLLQPQNLKPAGLKKNSRDCLACDRAKSRVRYWRLKGHTRDFAEEADRQYRSLLAAPEAPRTVLRGEAAGGSKLTEDEVRQIRADRASGVPACALAEQYGMDVSQIRNIVSRRHWRHVS